VKTCIIMGNGPSLNDVPADFLAKYETFGTNKIFLKMTPKYYVAINPLVVKQNLETINQLACMRYVRAGMGAYGVQLTSATTRPFSYEPMVWVNEGYTVTYVCLQLAYWMGFDRILLVGVDHRYQYDGKPNEQHKMGAVDPNHFDPHYFANQEWNNPDLSHSEMYYEIARDIYASDKRSIINLTPNTALKVFETGEMQDWL
jgi:hypothetical protein